MEFGFPVEAVVILTVAVVASVWLDLFSHRNDEEVTFKNAAIWSVFLGGPGAGVFRVLVPSLFPRSCKPIPSRLRAGETIIGRQHDGVCCHLCELRH